MHITQTKIDQATTLARAGLGRAAPGGNETVYILACNSREAFSEGNLTSETYTHNRITLSCHAPGLRMDNELK